MIYAKELMIDNWVLVGGAPQQVSMLHPTCGVAVYGMDYQPENDIDPIPLTPELLEKCEFVLNDSKFENIKLKYWVNKCVCLFFNDSDPNSFLTGYGFVVDGKYYASTFNWNTRFLHQLQNLCFCLGVELNIEL